MTPIVPERFASPHCALNHSERTFTVRRLEVRPVELRYLSISGGMKRVGSDIARLALSGFSPTRSGRDPAPADQTHRLWAHTNESHFRIDPGKGKPDRPQKIFLPTRRRGVDQDRQVGRPRMNRPFDGEHSDTEWITCVASGMGRRLEVGDSSGDVDPGRRRLRVGRGASVIST